MPEHHLHLDLLIDYAAGSAPEPVSLLVATHLTFCPSCRQHVARLEDVGGALLDDIEPVPVDSEALDRMLARLIKPNLRYHRLRMKRRQPRRSCRGRCATMSAQMPMVCLGRDTAAR